MANQIVHPLAPADPTTFTGAAYTCLMGAADEEVAIRLYYVRFEAGARTNWHAHAGAQILVVTAGRCRYQIAGDRVREIRAGESVRFEPGVRHWHGAVASETAEHIAVNLNSRETNWLEQVSETDYRGGEPARPSAPGLHG